MLLIANALQNQTFLLHKNVVAVFNPLRYSHFLELQVSQCTDGTWQMPWFDLAKPRPTLV
jgi:hypothetical protein